MVTESNATATAWQSCRVPAAFALLTSSPSLSKRCSPCTRPPLGPPSQAAAACPAAPPLQAPNLPRTATRSWPPAAGISASPASWVSQQALPRCKSCLKSETVKPWSRKACEYNSASCSDKSGSWPSAMRRNTWTAETPRKITKGARFISSTCARLSTPVTSCRTPYRAVHAPTASVEQLMASKRESTPSQTVVRASRDFLMRSPGPLKTSFSFCAW
mmetsp:Transcript_79387/g.219561  ORF Transcript_79387/g.219561 Transcript_79387/m.219561 type:complete len:217 (+) Transcript_79387:669-1319(+)